MEANRILTNCILISQRYSSLVPVNIHVSADPLRSRHQGEIKHDEGILLERK